MNNDGIFLLNKSAGMTSHTAMQAVKRLLKIKKAGHTGSLDPLATGMLPICLGEATKFSQFLLESDKYYRVTAELGIQTTTGDAEGEIIATFPIPKITFEQLTQLTQQLIGPHQQIPPMYSAIKYQGKPLYKLARQGIEIERAPRQVHLYQLNIINYQLPYFTMDVHCSKGTYIRTLVEEIGKLLGCGAYVVNLHRTAVAPYINQTMYSLEELNLFLEQQKNLINILLPIKTALKKLPEIILPVSSAFYFCQGQSVFMPNNLSIGEWVCVLGEKEKLLGMGEIIENGRIKPKRLVNFSDID